MNAYMRRKKTSDSIKDSTVGNDMKIREKSNVVEIDDWDKSLRDSNEDEGVVAKAM